MLWNFTVFLNDCFLNCIILNVFTSVSGFEKPSAIQQRSIRPIIKGRDVIAQAQSGTGKTATFSISILQSLDTSMREVQVLCLSPTRELATQIQKVRVILSFCILFILNLCNMLLLYF